MWRVFEGEASDVDGKDDACAVAVGRAGDGASDGGCILVQQGGGVGDANGVVVDHCSVTEGARHAGGGVLLGANESKTREGRDQDCGAHFECTCCLGERLKERA